MSIRAAVYAILTGDTTVNNLVSGHVFRQVIPQQGGAAAYVPAITFRVANTNRSKTFCRTDGTVMRRVSVDAYAVTQTEAEDIAEAAGDALRDYRGTVEGLFIADISQSDEYDLEDIEPGLYRVHQEYEVWHRPAA